ncbi:uncharacterized protein LOC117173692 [Belonocnema kinseyi]|uniref:uncharacterized protein LOC117173692 n=1 Tax=Belonocnema kinseyi TaxID=2817044 RepID=UPI00143D826C|nr:uncharacterized protein LOC117173692 [Belonocnema kinseyi]
MDFLKIDPWMSTFFSSQLMTSIGPLVMGKSTIHSAHHADFSDQGLDSCNARKLIPIKDKRLTQVVTNETPHLQFWVDAVKRLENMRFVSKDKLGTSFRSALSYLHNSKKRIQKTRLETLSHNSPGVPKEPNGASSKYS